MRFNLFLILLVACGVHAAGDSDDTESEHAVANMENFSGENTEENIGGSALAVPETVAPLDPLGSRRPIPALILPNNVCIINTDLSPGRSIDEHIMACVMAHRARRTITQ
tara:strand:+ start:195 stop:524 length:330 start_codon:yes stop_codon:yes gene_type:complete